MIRTPTINNFCGVIYIRKSVKKHKILILQKRLKLFFYFKLN
jgi:hypothetical protein